MSHVIDLLDEATRPKAPPIEGVSEWQRAHGRRLAMIHDLHLAQMAEVRAVMEQVAAGEAEATRLGEALTSMRMRRNYHAFGNLCGQECRMLTFHHTAEDRMIFPLLMREGGEGLRKVIERLAGEHLVIHRLIEEMERAAEEAMGDPGETTFGRLREAFERLERVVRSHFGYEQEQLEEAIGHHGVPM